VRQFKVILAAIAVAGLASAANAAAVTTLDTSLADPPGVFFGTGNFNDGYAVTTDDGLQIGLKSKINKDASDSITPAGDVYSIGLGHKVNFDYAVIPGSVDLTGATATLTILNVDSGQTYSFDASPANLPLGDTTLGSAYENSEQLAFFPVNYNMNDNDTFDVTLTLNNVQGISGPVSVENVIKIGSGTPEPASWALMILGLGGIGGALRRNRKSTTAAAIA
jgi:hypothetical protein